MKIDSNSNSHATAAGNAKLNKFVPILFYWRIFHTCAPSSANKRNDMAEGGWRAAVIASNKRIEHTSRRATFKSFMTIFSQKKLQSSCKLDLSPFCITHWLSAASARTVAVWSQLRPADHKFKKKTLRICFFFIFSSLFSNYKCFDAMERRRCDKLRIYECWIRGYWILFALISLRFISRCCGTTLDARRRKQM